MDATTSNEEIRDLINKIIFIETVFGKTFRMKVGDAGFGSETEGAKKEKMILTDSNIPGSGLKFFKCMMPFDDMGWSREDVRKAFGVLGSYREAWFICLNQIKSFSVIQIADNKKNND